MNREQAKQILPVIQQWVDGGVLQVNHMLSGWTDLDDVEFNCDPCKYRIKPELHDFNWALRRAVEDGAFSFRDSDAEWLLMNMDGGLHLRRMNMKAPALNRLVEKADLDATDWRPVVE